MATSKPEPTVSISFYQKEESAITMATHARVWKNSSCFSAEQIAKTAAQARALCLKFFVDEEHDKHRQPETNSIDIVAICTKEGKSLRQRTAKYSSYSPRKTWFVIRSSSFAVRSVNVVYFIDWWNKFSSAEKASLEWSEDKRSFLLPENAALDFVVSLFMASLNTASTRRDYNWHAGGSGLFLTEKGAKLREDLAIGLKKKAVEELEQLIKSEGLSLFPDLLTIRASPRKMSFSASKESEAESVVRDKTMSLKHRMRRLIWMAERANKMSKAAKKTANQAKDEELNARFEEFQREAEKAFAAIERARLKLTEVEETIEVLYG